jgi:hypothetical protein
VDESDDRSYSVYSSSPLERAHEQQTTQDIDENDVDENGLPPLSIKVTDVNRHQHLDGIVRFKSLSTAQGLIEGRISPPQKRQRGVGSQAYDPAQSDIRKFFGGGVINGKKEILVEGEIVDPHL